jgi:hypothetical protein
MSMTLEEISGYLDNHQIAHRLDLENRQILAGVAAENVDNFLIVIQLHEEGEFFKIFAPAVLTGIHEHQYKEAIFQTMLSIAWETKMMQWEYDASDGEVRAMIEFPLEDARLTERQFFRCLTGLVEMVDNIAMPRLKGVMQSGQDPGDQDPEVGERLLLTIQQEAPGLLDVLDKAMEARKRRGQNPPNPNFPPGLLPEDE